MPQAGLLDAEKKMWDANLERGTLELRHKQILARVDVLNSMNTQAMLVAGAAVASLGGESLQTLDEAENHWHTTLSAAFVGTSALTMACSLWVIIVASNLITLSQQSVLQGASSEEVSTVDSILSRKVADVRAARKRVRRHLEDVLLERAHAQRPRRRAREERAEPLLLLDEARAEQRERPRGRDRAREAAREVVARVRRVRDEAVERPRAHVGRVEVLARGVVDAREADLAQPPRGRAAAVVAARRRAEEN